MYCPQPTGTGTTLPEQFTFTSPDMSSTPIKPGQNMLMKSTQTSKWCRVLPDGKIMCDLDSSAGASVLGYTGTGVQPHQRGAAGMQGRRLLVAAS